VSTVFSRQCENGVMGSLSDEIRRLRSLKGLSVRGLAMTLKKTPGYISRIEAKGEIPTPELLALIAEELDGDCELLLALARADEISDAQSEIDDRYKAALLLFRKGKHAE